MNKIFYVNGLCGSGKTSAALDYVARKAKIGLRFIIACPSKDLINQSLARLQSIAPDLLVAAYHSDLADGVVNAIMNHVNNAGSEGQVLLITQTAFSLIQCWHDAQNWHVIWDEVPQAEFCASRNLPISHGILTNRIVEDADDMIAGTYVRIRPHKMKPVQAIAANKQQDEVLQLFSDIAQKIISPFWRCYVHHDQYHQILDRTGQAQLQIYGYLLPTLFQPFGSVTIMAACFEQSVLYAIWQQLGVEFVPHQGLTKKLRYTQHSNGERLTIRYASEAPWSKHLRDKSVDDDSSTKVLERVIDTVKGIMADTPFVWMANLDVESSVFPPSVPRLPNTPHGLNDYQHMHHAVVLSALNPSPAHYRFLEALGLDSTAVRQACYWHQVYQAAMRISLRDLDDHTPKSVTVMDRDTANWLAGLFPGAHVVPLGVAGLPGKAKSGRPAIYACDADRVRANRNRFKDQLREALQDHERVCRDLLVMQNSLFASTKATHAATYADLSDPDAFIALLWDAANTPATSKQAVPLISPAMYDPTIAATMRGEANIVSTCGIWLDNDGGDLTHQEFAKIFRNLRIVVFNTFSSRAKQPRYRVFIPTTIAMPANAYKAITSRIMQVLNQRGYWDDRQIEKNPRIKGGKRHGFDISKLGPTSLFYLPSQAQNAADRIFVDYADRKRRPLDPYEWAEYAADNAPAGVSQEVANDNRASDAAAGSTISSNDNVAAQVAALAPALAEWRAAGNQPGTGNTAFWNLAVAASSLGLPMPDIQQLLNREAGQARSPQERRAQIPSIINSLMNRVRGRA